MNQEILWKQYSQIIDLYKFYMELLVKLNVFYYAVTGAIVSFYFSKPNIENIKLSLLLPIVMSFAFAGFFIYGGLLMRPLRKEVFELRDALQLKVAPDVGVLSIFLYLFGAIFTLVAFGCIYLMNRCF